MSLLNLHFKRLGKCISKIINSHKTLMLIIKAMIPVKDKYIWEMGIQFDKKYLSIKAQILSYIKTWQDTFQEKWKWDFNLQITTLKKLKSLLLLGQKLKIMKFFQILNNFKMVFKTLSQFYKPVTKSIRKSQNAVNVNFLDDIFISWTFF